ncbi:hypothetical protein Stube_10530 [Streptomyces tubercidicus]|uniref:Uncharacterized protein n=1 Tax=Streptomyces tubercidicus TaxID=47759 RepID=A0A640ULG0_9ACTN|nr:hypothetical protein Stube_10530 [Streptomyces tubercidicus]
MYAVSFGTSFATVASKAAAPRTAALWTVTERVVRTPIIVGPPFLPAAGMRLEEFVTARAEPRQWFVRTF